MFKKATIALVSALLLLPTLASAKDMTGKFGIGYYVSDAPVGLRYWMTPKVGLDIGLGLDMTDLGDESATSYFFEVGIPYVVVGTERANFFIRPGVAFGILDDRVYGSGTVDDTWTDITITLAPGAEVFFGDNFSLEASHGIGIQILSPPEGDSLTNVSTFGAGVSELGFHFYF